MLHACVGMPSTLEEHAHASVEHGTQPHNPHDRPFRRFVPPRVNHLTTTGHNVELPESHTGCFNRSTRLPKETIQAAGDIMAIQTDPLQIKVLMIEDDPSHVALVENVLGNARGAMEVRMGTFVVTTVDRLEAGLGRVGSGEFDAVLLDLHLPDSHGIETLIDLRSAAGQLPIVVLTGLDDDGLALTAIQHGAQDYVNKDRLDGRLLRRTIRHAIERKRAETRLRDHAQQMESARSEIEQQATELRTRAEQLDRINRELDEFTYIASHDLKEPLRGISAYCEMLLEDYHDKIDSEGQDRLKTLTVLCQRLETLIGDLLTYCRVGGTRPAETGIDLNEVVAEVIDTLRPAIERRGASVCIVDRLPTITGDATLIGMAIGNLISNGLKFNDRSRPEVRIGCAAGDPTTIVVRDNGIGISAKHHEAIFSIFRRLHGRKQYEGSGVGLTVVRKIVEAHGGGVSIKSQPGKGTTFYLTLGPAARKAVDDSARPKPPHWKGQSGSRKRAHRRRRHRQDS